jgi:hypothetical protein
MAMCTHACKKNAHCLEGIHLAYIDGNATALQVSSGSLRPRCGKHRVLMLGASAGFEDYYLSGQYFDAGTFRSALAGLTYEV